MIEPSETDEPDRRNVGIGADHTGGPWEPSPEPVHVPIEEPKDCDACHPYPQHHPHPYPGLQAANFKATIELTLSGFDTTSQREYIKTMKSFGSDARFWSMDLRRMQNTQPWTAPYSPEFERSEQTEPHRTLMHDLMHLTKAVGILSSVAEWADHGALRLAKVDQAEYEGRVADLVMCALHIANHPPTGYAAFDLETAVVDRVERVNGVTDWRGTPTKTTLGRSREKDKAHDHP